MSRCPHIAWAFKQAIEHNLPPLSRLVLVAVAERANGALVCWPSVATIATDTGVSKRTVQTALRLLEDKQLIRVELRTKRSSHYHVLRPLETCEQTATQPKMSVGVMGAAPAPIKQSTPQLLHPSPSMGASPAPIGPEKPPAEPAPRVQEVHPESLKKVSKKERAEDVPIAARATELPPGPDGPARVPPNVRSELFSEGVTIFRDLTGKTDDQARAAIGKLLKESRNDCAKVLAAIRQAADDNPAELFPWLLVHVRRKQQNGRPGPISLVTGKPIAMPVGMF